MRSSCLAALGIVAALLLLRSVTAWAWTCDNDLPEEKMLQRCVVLPTANGVAPRNTRVRIACRDEGVFSLDYVPLRSKSEFRFALRAPKVGPVAVDQHLLPIDGLLGVELVPRAPLAENARYVVVRTPSGKSVVLSSFRTSATIDTERPVGAPILDGKVLIFKLKTDAHPMVFVVPRLTVGDVTDATTPAGALVYEVWTRRPADAIDYTNPPRGVFLPTRDPQYGNHETLDLGTTELCQQRGNILPREYRTLQRGLEGELDLLQYEPGGKLPWRRGIKQRIGVRAVDLAGNASQPAELVIDFDHPGTVRRPYMSDMRDYCESEPYKGWREVAVWPRASDVAPTNSRVRVFVTNVPYVESALPAKLVLRGPGDAAVAVIKQHAAMADTHLYTLTPKLPLVPRARYQVIDEHGNVLGSFQTGSAEDHRRRCRRRASRRRRISFRAIAILWPLIERRRGGQ